MNLTINSLCSNNMANLQTNTATKKNNTMFKGSLSRKAEKELKDLCIRELSLLDRTKPGSTELAESILSKYEILIQELKRKAKANLFSDTILDISIETHCQNGYIKNYYLTQTNPKYGTNNDRAVTLKQIHDWSSDWNHYIRLSNPSDIPSYVAEEDHTVNNVDDSWVKNATKRILKKCLKQLQEEMACCNKASCQDKIRIIQSELAIRELTGHKSIILDFLKNYF